jgi:tyrosinase
MEPDRLSRRRFVAASASAAALASLPHGAALAQTLRRRPEWQDFKKGPYYAPFVNAVRKMQANTNVNDRNSWSYWVKAHENYCPHGVPYFFVWHRGFIYYFEQALRSVSGNSGMQLPYWDYFKYATMPAELTSPATGNPLYASRANTNIHNALSLAPFGLLNFERGQPNSYEASIEPTPHGEIHNLIGGAMAGMQSPRDPVFWLHHCQMDRLWHAWALAGNGRHMPPLSDSYWSGSIALGPGLSIARSKLFDPRTALAYTYQDESLPTSYPPQAGLARPVMRAAVHKAGNNTRNPFIMPIALQGGAGVAAEPGSAATEARQTGSNRRSVGGVRAMTLDEQSVSARVRIGSSDIQFLKSIVGSLRAPPFGRAQGDAQPYSSVQVVLDDVQVTKSGEAGGFFYEVYLGSPSTADPASFQKYRVGSFGAFEIAAAKHHGSPARLVFPVTQLLGNLSPSQLAEMTVSFVRVNGNSALTGPAVTVGEMRIELSTDNVE